MLVALDTPYADTSAADLGFTVDAPEQPALHVLDVGDLTDGGSRLWLRLLGASHQVVLRGPGIELIETVACLPDRHPDLPPTVEDPDTGYRFTARVLRLTAKDLAARTAALRADLADDPYALVGVFPGSPDAVTALRVRVGPAGSGPTVGWRTWHAYPQTGELVETETVVKVR